MSDEPMAMNVRDAAEQISHLLHLGQHDRAQKLAMDVIAANPDAPNGHIMLAKILLDSGHEDAALDVLERALVRAPDNDVLHFVRSSALFNLGRFAEGELALRTSMELDPSDSACYAQYAHMLSQCDLDQEALGYAERALELDPDNAGLHRLRARLLLYVHPRHWSMSEQAVRVALRLNPNSAHSHAVLGMVLLRAMKNEGAEEAFRAALRLEPHNALALSGLSELVKGKYWWYRPLLMFGQFLSRQGQDGQLGILFGLWAAFSTISALIPPGYEGTRQTLTMVYLGFCLYTWFAEPITRALLRRAYPWLK